MVPFKPETTFTVKIEVSNAGALVPLTLAYDFTVTIIDACKDNALSFATTMTPIAYVIDNKTPSSTTADLPVSFPSVTATVADSTRCPVTVNMQIENNGSWLDVSGNEATYPWIKTGTYATGIGFTI